jgi:Flp pilus assembly protein TadD
LSAAERPADAQARNVLGTVLLRLGDVDAAIDEFRQGARLDPRAIEARVNLAQALSRAGRTDESRAVLEEAQRLKEQEAELGRAMVLVGLAAGQLEKGETAAAIANLRDATDAAPDFAEAHHRLGLALLRPPERKADAEESLLRAVRLAPDRAAYRYEWARLLAARGDATGALDQLRQAVELAPSLVPAQRELARVALAAREWSTAERALRSALAFGGDDAALHRDLAMALEGLGRTADAARERAAARKLETAPKTAR